MNSIWLTPEPGAGARFKDRIDKLAGTYRLYAFEPHVTLASGVTDGLDATICKCKSIFANLTEECAQVTGADGTDEFYTSLFLDIDISDELIGRRNKLCREIGGAGPEPYRPHISLAYGFENSAERADLITGLRTEFTGVNFRLSSVEIWQSPESTPVDSWKRLWCGRVL